MYQRILVPVDGSDTSARGLAEALKIAKSLGSTVHLFHVVDLSSALGGVEGAVLYADKQTADLRREGARVLEAAVGEATQAGVTATSSSSEILTGRAADDIVIEIGRAQPDLVVIGTHGRRGFSRAVLGSDAELVARRSTVPVLLVPKRET